MLKRIFLIFLLLVPCFIAAANLSPADSIRHKLPTLHGQAKLDALADLRDLAGNGNIEAAELKAADEYIAEALRQKKTVEAAHGMAIKISIIANYGDLKTMEAEKSDLLRYMRDNQRWNDYYDAWSIVVCKYTGASMMLKAAKEAGEMYEDARKRSNKYGLGIACYVMGQVYFSQGNIPQAEMVYEKAVHYLSTCGSEASMLLSAYSDYADVLNSQKNYKKMAKIVAEWKNTIDKLKADDSYADINNDFYKTKYKQCYVSMAEVAMNTGRMAEAGELFAKAEKMAEGGALPGLSNVLYGMTFYYQKKRDYKTALSTCRRCKAILERINDQTGLISIGELESELLIQMSRPAEAAYIYQKLLPRKDSLYNAQSRIQMNELNTLYKLDDLKIQQERMKYTIIAVTACSILLVLILTLYIIHLRKLRAKNRVIYEKLKSEMADEAEILKAQERIPEAELSADELLYRRICELMQTKALYKDAEMNRETIASELGTNYAYIATAIHNCAGISVMEYLNRLRLQHSVELLTEKTEMSVNEVSNLSGFNTRVSFYRQFRDKYGMSPSEFRKAAVEKKKAL
jgi:AraC-like DNA-binding protein